MENDILGSKTKIVLFLIAVVIIGSLGVRLYNARRFHLEKQTRFMMDTYVTLYAVGPEKSTSDAMDLIIGEVKTGRPRLNPHMKSEDTLYRALVRFGFCPPDRLDQAVEELKTKGETWVRDGGVAIPSRVRIAAFGDGEEHQGEGFTIIPLKRVAAFVLKHLREHKDVLHPVRITDPTLGLLHLLEKLGADEEEG